MALQKKRWSMGILDQGISGTKPITSNLRTDSYMGNEDKDIVKARNTMAEATRTWIREKADADYKPPQTSTAMGVRGSADSKLANPGKVDENLWDKAKKATEKEYGKDKWPVVTSIYEKMGGKFHKKK